MRGKQPDDVAERLQSARPVMRRSAGFEYHRRRRLLGEEGEESPARQPAFVVHPSWSMRHGCLKHRLCEIDGNDRILHRTPPDHGLTSPFYGGMMMPRGRRSPCHRLQPTAAGAILRRCAEAARWADGVLGDLWRDVMEYVVREYCQTDAAALRQCVVELQEFERTIDPRLQPGDTMAVAYCEHIHARCLAAGGKVFVAELGDAVVGFVAVLAHEPFTELDDPPGTYALITALVVLAPHRRCGIGRQLLERAEAFAQAAGAPELRIGVLAKNEAARQLYLAAAFLPHLEVFAKRW